MAASDLTSAIATVIDNLATELANTLTASEVRDFSRADAKWLASGILGREATVYETARLSMNVRYFAR